MTQQFRLRSPEVPIALARQRAGSVRHDRVGTNRLLDRLLRVPTPRRRPHKPRAASTRETAAAPPEDRPGLLTRGEAAERAGVTYNTIRLWEQAGRLHPVLERTGRPGTIYIRASELDGLQHEDGALSAGLIWGGGSVGGLDGSLDARLDPALTEQVAVSDAAAASAGPANRDLSTFARESAIKLVGSVANGAFGFLAVVVITRALHAQRAGAFFEAFALFTILTNMALLGADTGFMRVIARYRALGRTDDLRPTLRVGIVPVIPFSIVLGAALFVLAPQFSHLLSHTHHGPHSVAHPGALVPYIRVLAPFIPLAALMTVMLAATRGFGTMLPSVVVNNIGGPGLRPLLVGGGVVAGLSGAMIAMGWVLPFAVGVPIAAVWLARLLRRAEARDDRDDFGPRPLRALASEFWRFSSPRALAAVFQTMITWLDTLLIGALRSTSDAGVYTAATRYILVGTSFIQTIVIVISPQIAGLMARREDRPRAHSLFKTSTAWLLVATWPVYWTLIVFAPLLLSVFGRQFVAGDTALVILASAVLFSTSVGPVTAVLLMGGKSVWNFINTVVSLSLNVVLNVLLIPRLGIKGAAIAWAVSIGSNNLLSLLEVRFLLKMSPFSSRHAEVAVVSTLVFGGLGLLVRLGAGTSIAGFAAFAVVGSAVYAVFLWLRRDRLQLTALLSSLRRGRGRQAGALAVEGDGRQRRGRHRPR